MAKKPKEKWQIEVRKKLDEIGIGYKELAIQTKTNEGTIRQSMCKNNSPGVKKKICEYLGIAVDEPKAG